VAEQSCFLKDHSGSAKSGRPNNQPKYQPTCTGEMLSIVCSHSFIVLLSPITSASLPFGFLRLQRR
jgi:hypothetical protein